MQICTRLQWRNAEVESDSSGWKGLTPWHLPVACVIVAVRLSKALRDAHDALKGNKQSARPCCPFLPKIAPREMKHALKMHVPAVVILRGDLGGPCPPPNFCLAPRLAPVFF